MTRGLMIAGALLALFFLLPGCTGVPRDAGFGDVERTVASRIGKRVQWNRGTAADREVEGVVQSMLRAELTADDAVQIALLNK